MRQPSTILDDARQRALAHLLNEVEFTHGAIAECGVYKGGNLRLMARRFPGRVVYGFDTFTGLPAESWGEGEPHAVGDFSDTSKNKVREAIGACPNVLLVEGIFPASAKNLEFERFSFVHLDFDFYESTISAINWFLPRMLSGGIIVFDDYKWARCPGVERAIQEAGLEVTESAKYQCYHKVP